MNCGRPDGAAVFVFLDPHQPVPPPGRQDRRVEVDAIDAEPVLLLKR